MGKLKLLIAEDEKVSQMLYRKGIELDKFKDVFDFTIVGDGEEALKTYENIQPDIVVLDIMMPIMSGFIVLKKNRQEQLDRSTVVIMASKLNEENDIKDCARIGIQGYIVKPINAKDIGDRILDCYQKKYPDKEISGNV